MLPDNSPQQKNLADCLTQTSSLTTITISLVLLAKFQLRWNYQMGDFFKKHEATMENSSKADTKAALTKRTRKVQCVQRKNRCKPGALRAPENFRTFLKQILIQIWNHFFTFSYRFFCSIIDFEPNPACSKSSMQQLHTLTNPKLALHPRFGGHI